VNDLLQVGREALDPTRLVNDCPDADLIIGLATAHELGSAEEDSDRRAKVMTRHREEVLLCLFESLALGDITHDTRASNDGAPDITDR
jgi:hypothetical protein